MVRLVCPTYEKFTYVACEFVNSTYFMFLSIICCFRFGEMYSVVALGTYNILITL